MTGNETAGKMGVFRCFVKSLSTQLVLTNESKKNHLSRRCWHFCWHFERRYKAPGERSRLHNGLIPACWRVMPNFLWNARSTK